MRINNISLIALDIGGTLLSDDNTITKKNLDAIKFAKENGIKIVLATAREYSSTKYISNQMDIKKLKSLKYTILKTKAVQEIYEYCRENNLYIHLNQEFCEVSDKMEYFNLKHHLLNNNYPKHLKSNCYLIKDLNTYISNNEITKIVIVSEESLDNHLEGIGKILSKYNLFITEYNKNLYENIIDKTINYLEIGATNETKCSGLINLANQLKIPTDEVLVFGDGINDMEMISKFEKSVCMANGDNKIKKMSKYITKKDNNHSGVSEGIYYFLKRR